MRYIASESARVSFKSRESREAINKLTVLCRFLSECR